MTSYWLSYRLQDSDGWDETYEERRKALEKVVRDSSGDGPNLWLDSTSFFIFASNDDIDEIVHKIKAAVEEDVDLVVIGMNDYLGGRVIGRCLDNDIFALIPSIKKA